MVLFQVFSNPDSFLMGFYNACVAVIRLYRASPENLLDVARPPHHNKTFRWWE